jgi:hypothetical protein
MVIEDSGCVQQHCGRDPSPDLNDPMRLVTGRETEQELRFNLPKPDCPVLLAGALVDVFLQQDGPHLIADANPDKGELLIHVHSADSTHGARRFPGFAFSKLSEIRYFGIKVSRQNIDAEILPENKQRMERLFGLLFHGADEGRHQKSPFPGADFALTGNSILFSSLGCPGFSRFGFNAGIYSKLPQVYGSSRRD